MGRLRRSLFLSLPLLLVAVLIPRKAHAKKPAHGRPSKTSAPVTRVSVERVQQIVDRIREELAIPDVVTASLVERNRLIVSVARAADRSQGFELLLESRFIDQLSADELEAVVAHELGHVWIFTHHPFLQTEEGANSVALKMVNRKTLEDVYTKVWTRAGRRGSLTYLPPTE